jgi:hypothetical protein
MQTEYNGFATETAILMCIGKVHFGDICYSLKNQDNTLLPNVISLLRKKIQIQARIL